MKKVTNYFKTAALAIALLASSAAYAVTGAPVQGSANLKGKALMDKSDCNACHQLEVKVVGPAFKDIAKKYKTDKTALTKLPEKIIKGGAGSWGDIPMAPHPQISKADATEMVKYILSLAPAGAATKPAAKKS
ncbi:cytochrome c class I [Adhaeribacter arboris]|uniref:Cytochrome c class I n=1 Tax=Adhaeribacter arboris TaxID=2072846 RepID=A0A2T2YGR5_9BACT|nr:c-type cytochrome [Adhaeribacter arboris]PSR54694.1 cytochrome c class I [Adhaeribacter arboris]